MKKVGEENNFKHKLNMLEPGIRMLKSIGILFLAGLLFYIFQLRIAAFCTWAASETVFAVLLILLVIEAHQDNVMNDIAIKENQKNGIE